MERFSTCDLRDKEVINLCDGSRLGCPTDFEFNACDGKITALIIAGQGRFFCFSSEKDIVIPWCKIECIGEDAILVRLPQNEFIFPDDDKKKKKKRTW